MVPEIMVHFTLGLVFHKRPAYLKPISSKKADFDQKIHSKTKYISWLQRLVQDMQQVMETVVLDTILERPRFRHYCL